LEVPLSHSYFIRDVRLQGNVRLLYIHVDLFFVFNQTDAVI